MEVADNGAEIAEIVASRLFETGWYLALNPDVSGASIDAVAHFCSHGWREGRAPNSWFDSTWYLQGNPDVAGAGINPLLHYVRHGEAEGRQPSAHFDPNWYHSAHALPDGVSALRHYLENRSGGGFTPAALLYAAPFLPAYREDVAAGVDPYLHCVEDAAPSGSDPRPDIVIVANSGLLDPNYYLINGSDVREASLDPAEHFCRYGWQENRKPNLYFDTYWYRITNPIVGRLGINPLVHYICEGEAAGRRPTVYFDPAWYRANYAEALAETGLKPLAHYLVYRRTQAFSPNPHFDATWYVTRYQQELGPNRDPFAHYLQMGTMADMDPSPCFDAATYRRRRLGRITRAFRRLLHPDRDNPLVHFLHSEYR